jgi:hypothetical protein
MCNKTCDNLISAESPAVARDLFPAGRTPPSRHVWGSNSGYRDLRTIFPPSLKRTPAQVAADHVVESEIALHAREEGDRVLRVQALRKKYESTAYLRQSFHHMQSNKRLVGRVPDLSMAVLLPTPLIPDHGTRSKCITQEAGDGAKDKDAVPLHEPGLTINGPIEGAYNSTAPVSDTFGSFSTINTTTSTLQANVEGTPRTGETSAGEMEVAAHEDDMDESESGPPSFGPIMNLQRCSGGLTTDTQTRQRDLQRRLKIRRGWPPRMRLGRQLSMLWSPLLMSLRKPPPRVSLKIQRLLFLSLHNPTLLCFLPVLSLPRPTPKFP